MATYGRRPTKPTEREYNFKRQTVPELLICKLKRGQHKSQDLVLHLVFALSINSLNRAGIPIKFDCELGSSLLISIEY